MTHRREEPKISIEEAATKYQEGTNLKDAAALCGKTVYEFRRYLDKAGITVQSRGRRLGIKSGESAKPKAGKLWSGALASDFLSRPLLRNDA